MSYSVVESGEKETTEHRVHLKKDGAPVSFFHDVPLYTNKDEGIVNMVFEIPRETNAKMEISTADHLNPIKQDVKNGKVRFVAWKYPFNYGALSQTWENPNVVDKDTNAAGDKDPLDAVEIGAEIATCGQIKQVKVLGVWAMIDEGETDWKILCVDVNDPLAAQLNDVDDVHKVCPDKVKVIYEFLRDYKTPDGKPQNQFAFDGNLKDKAFALKVIAETHEEWQKIQKKEVALEGDEYKIDPANTTLQNEFTVTE